MNRTKNVHSFSSSLVSASSSVVKTVLYRIIQFNNSTKRAQLSICMIQKLWRNTLTNLNQRFSCKIEQSQLCNTIRQNAHTKYIMITLSWSLGCGRPHYPDKYVHSHDLHCRIRLILVVGGEHLQSSNRLLSLATPLGSIGHRKTQCSMHLWWLN